MRAKLFGRPLRTSMFSSSATSDEKSAVAFNFAKCLASIALGALLWLLVYAAATHADSSNTISLAYASDRAAFQQEASSLPLLSPLERELKGGENHAYRIPLTSGQFLHALIEQKGIDVVVSSFGANGQQLASVDSPNDQWGTEPVLLVAATPGDYRVEVRSTNSKAPAGRYAIRIVALRGTTPEDISHVAAERLFEEAQKLRSQQTAASRRSAIERYKQALPLFLAVGDTYRQAITLLAMGYAHAQLSEFRQALVYFNETLSLSQAMSDRRFEAATETFVGGMHDALGDIRSALDHYNRALTLSKESGNRAAEASTLVSIGAVYNDIADWQSALEYYRQALPLHKALGNQQREGNTLHNIGVVYYLLGDQREALRFLQEALPSRRATGDKNGEADTLIGLGNANIMLDEPQKALGYFNQALPIYREIGNRGREATTLDYIGQSNSAMGQPEKALEYHQRALQLQRATGNLRREAISLSNLGHVYNLLGQPDKSLEHFNLALSNFRNIGDLNNSAIALEGIARAEQSSGKLHKAREHVEEALALVEQIRATRVGGQQSRTSYFSTRQGAYELYVDLLMQMHRRNPSVGHDAEALLASERSRARSLVELLNEARVDIRQGVEAALIERERDVIQLLNAKAQRHIQLLAQKGNKEQLAALSNEIGALKDEYQQVQTKIRKSSPRYSALVQPAPLSLAEIRRDVLDKDTLLLEYSLGKERSYLWAVTQDSLKAYELPGSDAIETAARGVIELLTARSQSRKGESTQQKQQRIAQADSGLSATARKLSDILLGPVESELGNKRLVIVADGALQYIPFGMLPVPSANAGGRGPGAGLPLIVEHEIVTLPSASTIAIQRHTLKGRQPAPNLIAVIADPVFENADVRFKTATSKPVDDQKQDPAEIGASTRLLEQIAVDNQGRLRVPRLPYTRQEAEQILSIAPRASNLKALDFNANLTAAKGGELGTYRYVHFATHGYVDAEREDLSALVLSLVDEKGKPQDGFLRLNEIYNLRLPAEMVVLSACQTGLGKKYKGEGLVGLTRGFMYAGAARVVVSLWNVSDKATAELMTLFYKGILKDKKTPAAALRAAQVELSKHKQWRAPYYWSAFILQGEWR